MYSVYTTWCQKVTIQVYTLYTIFTRSPCKSRSATPPSPKGSPKASPKAAPTTPPPAPKGHPPAKAPLRFALKSLAASPPDFPQSKGDGLHSAASQRRNRCSHQEKCLGSDQPYAGHSSKVDGSKAKMMPAAHILGKEGMVFPQAHRTRLCL